MSAASALRPTCVLHKRNRLSLRDILRLRTQAVAVKIRLQPCGVHLTRACGTRAQGARQQAGRVTGFRADLAHDSLQWRLPELHAAGARPLAGERLVRRAQAADRRSRVWPIVRRPIRSGAAAVARFAGAQTPARAGRPRWRGLRASQGSQAWRPPSRPPEGRYPRG